MSPGDLENLESNEHWAGDVCVAVWGRMRWHGVGDFCSISVPSPDISSWSPLSSCICAFTYSFLHPKSSNHHCAGP